VYAQLQADAPVINARRAAPRVRAPPRRLASRRAAVAAASISYVHVPSDVESTHHDESDNDNDDSSVQLYASESDDDISDESERHAIGDDYVEPGGDRRRRGLRSSTSPVRARARVCVSQVIHDVIQTRMLSLGSTHRDRRRGITDTAALSPSRPQRRAAERALRFVSRINRDAMQDNDDEYVERQQTGICVV
jgi:hypothetical protein